MAAVIAIGLLAASLPAPPSDPGPEFTEPIEPATEAGAQPSLWYCPWINSGATRDTRVAAAFLADVEIAYTHPDPRVGEPEDVALLRADGPGAVVQDIAEIANRGDAPGLVEFSNGPATAAAIVAGESSLSGDRCIGSVPKLWHIAGLTTRDGYALTLRLFNPFPDNAKVVVRAASELGSEALPDLQSIDVVGKNWVDIALDEAIPFLDTLAITVGTEEGTIIPTVVQSRGADEASWPGTGLATEWLFPTAALSGLAPRLAVWNPSERPVEIEVDLFTRTSAVGAVRTTTIEAGRPFEVSLADESTGALGVRVRATGPVAAVVVAEDVPADVAGEDDSIEGNPAGSDAPVRIAATIGAPQASKSWLLAGVGGQVGGDSSIWLLNPNGQPVTVTIQPLGRAQLAADKVRVEPNTIRRVRLTATSGVGGYRLDAALPIVASWSLQTPDAVALLAGVAIGE